MRSAFRTPALRRLAALLLCMLLPAIACQTTPATQAPSVALALGASSSAQPLLIDLMAAYHEQQGHVTIAPE